MEEIAVGEVETVGGEGAKVGANTGVEARVLVEEILIGDSDIVSTVVLCIGGSTTVLGDSFINDLRGVGFDGTFAPIVGITTEPDAVITVVVIAVLFSYESSILPAAGGCSIC